MTRNRRKLHLNVFMIHTGHHEAAWRHPLSEPSRVTDVDYYVQMAKTAERGKLDSLFLSDAYSLPPTVRYKPVQALEPFTLLAALAMETERIGLIGTASTTYNEPYHIARKFASLDHISGGRTGWNIVTSTGNATALNFTDAPLPEHSERYKRAAEFVEVVAKLWDSWDDDAVTADKANGIYADPGKIRAVNHKGEYFNVRGPLNIPRPPQGWPLLVQAGASDSGKAFAARVAEAVFTAQNSLGDAKLFYADLKARMGAWGRKADELRILPGFCPIIGDTAAEAADLEAELHGLIQPEYGVYRLSNLFGVDLSGYPLDKPLPLEALPHTDHINSQKGRHHMFVEMARRDKLTIRELIVRTASSRGHFALTGTPLQIADEMGRWLNEGAADGFNLMPPYLPGGLDVFVDKVVPELQNRGLFRTEYEGATLREHYGAKRPSGYGGAAAQAAFSAGGA